jgi:hypothetical protein
VPEVLFARGHVLKRAGDLEGAARALEQARLLDKSDRFLNGKAGKYWLRAGQIEKAGQVFGLFTKVSFEWPVVSLASRWQENVGIYRKTHRHLEPIWKTCNVAGTWLRKETHIAGPATYLSLSSDTSRSLQWVITAG